MLTTEPMQATNIVDANPRPLKRQRTDTASMDVDGNASNNLLSPIPPANLLLALPSLLIHPPTHPHHQFSLKLSSEAIRNLLNLSDVDGDMECRAWTAFAEVGIVQGLQEPAIADEIEKAIAKALLLAQKHPSLRFYKPHLSLLSARMAYEHQNNPKYAQHTVRRLLNSLAPSDPPHVLYTAHLALISYSEMESSTKLLDTIQHFQTVAANNGHDGVVLLAQVIRLRVLLQEGLWPAICPALKEAEEAFRMNFDNEGASPMTEEPAAELALLIHLLVMGVVYYTYAGETENASSRLTKLHALLDKGALDKLGESGIVEFPLPRNSALHVQMTHPRVLYLLAFLVSSVSKRNPVGRKPKRKVFAMEGLSIAERELRKEIALPFGASHQDAEEAYSKLHMLKADLLSELVANSICRNEFDDAAEHLNTLIAYTRSNSLFPTYAARIALHHAHLAHTLAQTERALDCYRVAAHLSKPRAGTDDPRGDHEDSCLKTPRKATASPTKKSGAPPLRSLSPRKRKSVSPTKRHTPLKIMREPLRNIDDVEDQQYPEDPWVYTAARAGEMWLRIGLARQQARIKEQDEDRVNEKLEELAAEGDVVARECEGLGGTLRTVGEVLKACLSEEVLKSKAHLRIAIELASAAQDNHLRALIVALISSHYLHTARSHAENMLLTCEQLAAGLGAQPRPANSGQGHAMGRLPLSTSDKVNIAREDPERWVELNASPKPRTKRKAGDIEEVENCAPSPRPSKKERINATDSSPLWRGDNVGNAQLRLWVGERFLELNRWAGNEQRVKMQEENVQKLQEAVRSIEKWVNVC